MNAPNGTTIVFDGGDFSGVLPAKVELAGSPRMSANGTNVDVRAPSEFTLLAGSSLTLTGGSFSLADATVAGTLVLNDVACSFETNSLVAVSGAFTFSGLNSAFVLETLTRSGGRAHITCASASGSNWNVDSLVSLDDVSITTLVCDGSISAGNCSGEDWTVGGIFTEGDVLITELESVGEVRCARAEGDDWTVGALLCSTAGIADLTTTGYEDGTFGDVDGDVYVSGNASGNNWNIAGLASVIGKTTIALLSTDGPVKLADDAGGDAWEIGGFADISPDGLQFEVPVVALNGEAKLPLDYVESLTINDGGVLIVKHTSQVDSLSTSEGASVLVDDGAILSARQTVSFLGETTLRGKGYFVIPASASTSNLIQAEGADVRVCRYGAELTGLSGVCVDGETVRATISKRNAVPVLTEIKIDDEWTLLNAEVSTETFTASSQGRITWLRAFDGSNFISASVYCAPTHAWLVYAKSVAVQTDVSWKITTEWIMASEYCRAGEAIVLRARVEKSETDEPLEQSAVDSISYTCYKNKTVWGAETKTPVQGHENVSVPINTVFDELVDDDPRWTKDETGYNWKFEPDTTTYPIFPTPGKYTILVTIRMNEGNPAPIYFEVEAN